MPSGYLEQTIDGYLEPVANPSLEVDMWLEQDTDGYLYPMISELTPVFPSVNDTTVRAGPYGWSAEYVPNFAIPPVDKVLQLYQFGSMGTELTGTLISGTTPAPNIPVVIATNDGDGKAITVIIQMATAGTTNRIWAQPIGHYQNPKYLATVIGNGTTTVYPGSPGTYVLYALSTIGNSLTAVGVSAYVELVGANGTRNELMSGPAQAHLQVCKTGMGTRIAFKNLKTDPWIGLWALGINGTDTVSTHGGQTSIRRAVMEIPRQAGWPPQKVNFQACIKIPESAADNDHGAIYGIEDLPSLNSDIGIIPVHRLTLTRMDYDSRLGG